MPIWSRSALISISSTWFLFRSSSRSGLITGLPSSLKSLPPVNQTSLSARTTWPSWSCWGKYQCTMNTHGILKHPFCSEEIFDFSAEQMTQLKAATLKTQMKSEFAEIYNLCREVLDKAVKPSLIKATLETLLRFVNWVPVGYIFETDLIETLRNKVCIFSLFLSFLTHTLILF